VLLHSSLKAIDPIDGGADAIIDAFLDVLTPEGLFVVPTHTWGTVTDAQRVFHLQETPSMVGALTNVVRLRSTAVRSLHPTHSVAGIGKRAREYCADHELDTTPCSPRSPYAKLVEWQGKVALLGVDLTRCTLFHCFEEMAGVGEIWTLQKESSMRRMIRADGSALEHAFRGHAGQPSNNYGRIEPELLALGVMTIHERGSTRLRLVDASAAARYLVPRLRENPQLFA
jgi:aminoglycoside 3-N-acetyltransferase